MKEDSSMLIFLGLIFIGLVVLASGLTIDTSHITNFDELVNNETGGVDVNIQDQTTRPFAVQVNQMLDSTSYSLASSPVIGSYELELNTVSGLSLGDKITFLEQNGMPQVYFGQIQGISGNTITLNDQVPYSFVPINTTVFTFENDITVDGSSTPVVYGLTNVFDEALDITRVIFKCTDNVEMHDGLFCGEDQLTRGVLFRKYTSDGYYINYWNVRSNAKWGLLAFDTSYDTNGKPPDDTYGFGSRLTYGGQSKHGVVIRLEPNERIELVIQDDLTSISGASLMVEGHFVQN